MSRYIDADLVKGAFQDKYVVYDDTLEIINSVPTADVVEVVRCKDCKHATMCEQVILYDDGTERVVNWCSRGERRENEQIHKYG